VLSLSQNKFWNFVLLHIKKKSKEKWRSIFSGNFLNNENLPPTHFWLLSFVLVSATNSVTYYLVIFSLSAKYCLVSFNKELLFVCLYYLYCGGSQTCVINCLIWKLKFFLFFLFTVERFQTFILETNFVHFESKAFDKT